MRSEQIDSVFFALSHPVRREMIDRLGDGDMSVKTLSAPFDESPAAITKHLKILERAALISRQKDGRRHILHFEPAALREANEWIGGARQILGRAAELSRALFP